MKEYNKPQIEIVEFDNRNAFMTASCTSVCSCVGRVDDGWEVCYSGDDCAELSF